jgi:hypothetical protein
MYFKTSIITDSLFNRLSGITVLMHHTADYDQLTNHGCLPHMNHYI